MIKNIDFLKDKLNVSNASQVGIVVKDIERAKNFIVIISILKNLCI